MNAVNGDKNEKDILFAESVEAIAPFKGLTDHNPLMTQKYSADPFAIVYDGRVYIYATGDEPMFESDGSVKKNNYSNIDTIRVISSADLVNWTDHGDIYAAGKRGAASWGNNSWAPAACWKIIDGKPKFFLYFANSGNGIAVLTSDSPTGPFIDPIGEALISRNTPTCNEVTWLFDPAVIVDDDGCGYLYFGGGIPSDDMISNPGTARVVKLSDDMISLDGDPVPIDNVLYLFEDSGINKVGNKYIYSYCSNFNVPDSGCEGYGFGSGEIITMVSENPMGPFKTVGSVLKNPGFFFNYGGNNHHCIFEFNGKWYITYHASLIEEAMGKNYGYRSVNIDEINTDENGLFTAACATKTGVKQIRNINPYISNSFATMSNQAGISVANMSTNYKDSCGCVIVETKENGAFIAVSGVDFADGANKCVIRLKSDTKGTVTIRGEHLNGIDFGKAVIGQSGEETELEINLKEKLVGIKDLYFVFEGVGVKPVSWIFE